MKAEGKDN